MEQVKTRMYFTGGCGLNLGMEYSPTSESVCFLDSSAANIRHAQINADRLYIIPDTDGAGGDQAYMMPFARKHAPQMLERFPAGTQNIVVTSGGGGTGPAIAIALVEELVKAGEDVFVLVIGSYDATRRVKNTINIVKNLELMPLKHEQNVVISYISNAGGEAAADEEALFVLSALDALTDQDNDRMDTRDLSNFMQPHRNNAIQPQLMALHIRETRQEAAQILEPISVAILVNDIALDIPYGSIMARTVGITRREDKLPGNQLHFVLNSVGVTDILNELEESLAKLNTVQSGFRQRKASFARADLGEGELFVS